MKPIKILFLGTTEFSRDCLQLLLSDSRFQVQAVITKPDSPSGRKLKMMPSPVRLLAEQRKIPVFTPQTLKKDDVWMKIPLVDIAIVCAYGKILPSFFLDRFHAVNIHASLLPKWRGAAPIQRSLLAGDKETGVTLQKVAQKMDTGDIIHQLAFPVSSDMDAIEVLHKIKSLSFRLLSHFLPLYLKKQIQPTPQDHSKASYAPKIVNSDLQIDWSQSAEDVFNHIKAMVLNGGSFTFYKEKRLKILKAGMDFPSLKPESPVQTNLPHKISKKGGIIGDYHPLRGLEVLCCKGSIFLLEVQIQGKKRQKIDEFLRGFKIKKGDVLTSSS